MRRHLFRASAGLAAIVIVGLATFNLTRTPVKSAFLSSKAAKNPVSLQLLVDEGKVVGWISGAKDYAGRTVTIQCGDEKATETVGEGNVFTWKYAVKAPTAATVTFGDFTQRVNLTPPTQLEPAAYFVVDRTVYRPGQKVQFAVFLRKRDAAGNFIPIRNEKVTVNINSERRNAGVARLKMTSDDYGRITGSYTFGESEVLDAYRIFIPGYQGEARVTLAEFRKAKIRLAIDGKVATDKLTVTFDALDFLEQHVPDAQVRYIVQVVRTAKEEKRGSLQPEEFVYNRTSTGAWWNPRDMSAEEALLAETEPSFMPRFNPADGTVVAQFDGDLKLADGHAEYKLPIKTEWNDTRHQVRVQGVLVDANGQEQRATREISLRGKEGTLKLSTEKRYFEPGEKISVTAESPRGADTSLVVMRLSPGAAVSRYHPGYYGDHAYSGVGFRTSSAAISPRWIDLDTDNVEHNLVTAVPLKGDGAEVTLNEPGAYTLVGISTLPDGTTARDEVGFIVQESTEQPGLNLKLDKDEYATGDTVDVQVSSRYRDARVLISLRDGTGLRWWKAVTLDGETARVRCKLDDDLTYGCILDVQYPEGGTLHVAQQAFTVVPEARTVRVTTTMKERVDAGEQVKIGIDVNRREAVDLVVSVYDKSLLGVAPDTAPDIRSFFLADDRAREYTDRDLLRRRLAGATIQDAMDRLDGRLKEMKDEKPLPPEYHQLRNALQQCKNGYLSPQYLPVLLDAVGIPALGTQHSWQQYRFKSAQADRITLFEVMDRWDSEPNRYFTYAFCGGKLLLGGEYPYAMAYDMAYAPMASNGFGIDRTYGMRRMAKSAAPGDYFASANASVSAQAAYSVQPIGPVPVDLGAGEGMPVRRDFSDLAFWSAKVRTDRGGRAEVEFKLPDSLTNWQVVVTAVAPDMSVGRATESFTSTRPIMVWPMLPRSFTEGDKVQIFGSVQNRSDRDQQIKVSCKVENGKLLDDTERTVSVKAGGYELIYWTFQPAEEGFAQILMTAKCGEGEDASLKRLPVESCSVEEVITASGFCKPETRITVPDDVDLSNASLEVSVSPTLAADMADTLPFLVDYPYGCIEQTMSRFLPAIRVAQTLKHYHINNPELEARLPKCVDTGIKRLLQTQQPDGGWGWNGSSATHEMMTPYALYGLLEAEKAGYSIGNEEAVTRGLRRVRQYIDAMGAAQASDRIYCMYVYAHREPVPQAWWTFIDGQADSGKLSDYAKALALEMAVDHGKKDQAKSLAAMLHASARRGNGQVYWRTAGFSRWGDDQHEVTAAVLKALVAHNVHDPLIPGVLSYFAQTKQGNRWNSTKDTAMIVYAVCDYLARVEMAGSNGKAIEFTVNEERAQTLEMNSGLAKKLTVDGKVLRHGANLVKFANAGPTSLYRLRLVYHKEGADIARTEKGITVSRRFYLLNEKGARMRQLKSGDTVSRGSYIESEVGVTYHIPGDMRYVLLRSPKLSNCETLPENDPRFTKPSTSGYVLREDRNDAIYFHHESTPRSFIDRSVLHAEFAGDFVAAPAAVELMYRPEVCGHSATFKLTVAE
ncbi:MAG: alpha-2-macroglobulin family protein [Armatimonadota bacterium]